MTTTHCPSGLFNTREYLFLCPAPSGHYNGSSRATVENDRAGGGGNDLLPPAQTPVSCHYEHRPRPEPRTNPAGGTTHPHTSVPAHGDPVPLHRKTALLRVYERSTAIRYFIRTFESAGMTLSLLSGVYEYFQEKLSTAEFGMLSQMDDVNTVRANVHAPGEARPLRKFLRGLNIKWGRQEWSTSWVVGLGLDERGRSPILYSRPTLQRLSLAGEDRGSTVVLSVDSPDVANLGC